MNWPKVWSYLYDNRVPIGVMTTAVATALVATAPIPENRFLLWMYDFWHQLFNIKNNRLAKELIPTPPETKEDVKSTEPNP